MSKSFSLSEQFGRARKSYTDEALFIKKRQIPFGFEYTLNLNKLYLLLTADVAKKPSALHFTAKGSIDYHLSNNDRISPSSIELSIPNTGLINPAVFLNLELETNNLENILLPLISVSSGGTRRDFYVRFAEGIHNYPLSFGSLDTEKK